MRAFSRSEIRVNERDVARARTEIRSAAQFSRMSVCSPPSVRHNQYAEGRTRIVTIANDPQQAPGNTQGVAVGATTVVVPPVAKTAGTAPVPWMMLRKP